MMLCLILPLALPGDPGDLRVSALQHRWCKKSLCNHLNKEQDTTIKVYKVHEVSSFLLKIMDPGKV